jgi:hypothetical protein
LSGFIRPQRAYCAAGLSDCVVDAAKNDIDFALLSKLNDVDLKELGVTSVTESGFWRRFANPDEGVEGRPPPPNPVFHSNT